MLRLRLLFAALLLVPLIGLLVADFYYSGAAPGVWLVPLVLALAWLAADESLAMLQARDHRPVAWSVHASVLLIVLAACAPVAWALAGGRPAALPLGPLAWPLLAATGALALLFVAEMRRYQAPGGAIVQVALASLVTMYVALPMTFVVQLRLYHDNAWGMAALVSLVFVAKWSDVGAYACGRLCGRRKMAPKLSPGKTVEGALGGVLAACLASLDYFFLIVPLIVGQPRVTSWWACLVFGLIVALAGMVGDLSESLLKRDMGKKDSSHWLPGLGGILDILDSVLFAAAPAYLCWATGWLGP